MSRENVETATRLFGLHARGEIDAMIAELDPQFEFDVSERLPDVGVIRGREAYADWLRTGFEMWSEFRIEVDRVLDVGDDRVLTLVRTYATGLGSGVPISEKVGYLGWFREDVLHRMKVYPTWDDSVAAAGRETVRDRGDE